MDSYYRGDCFALFAFVERLKRLRVVTANVIASLLHNPYDCNPRKGSQRCLLSTVAFYSVFAKENMS